ncbi:hypothetical protein LOC71_15150 [Rhodopirellula sp. JC740]|uniref:Phage shock protein B n=1 Tax=Rhodopirellula halodulae TaxID=2894198 RepID=A0ABS8NJ80_9BACT|nr:hypothetical protein [Rhodopirellula sp. JC740]MCC9643621.1 hypothetical protein [Rhodopirellula sp. JC740]
MIPALLSCVFVIYLYRSLNAPETPIGHEERSADDLNQRLSHLQSRMEKLASSANTEDAT